MASSRKIIAEFIGVFLIGGLAGGMLTCAVTDKQLTSFMTRTNDPATNEARINQKYASEYHLTPEEMDKIAPLTKQMAQDLYKIRHQFGVDVLTTLDNDHAQIAAQMTPEHRAVYEAAMADHHKKLSAQLLNDQSSPTPEQK